jgi:hypothetical protein
LRFLRHGELAASLSDKGLVKSQPVAVKVIYREIFEMALLDAQYTEVTEKAALINRAILYHELLESHEC